MAHPLSQIGQRRDALGLVPPPSREAGRRRYDDAAVAKVGVILLLREVGFTLAEIAELTGGERWRDLAVRKTEQIDAFAARLHLARTALEQASSARTTAADSCGVRPGPPSQMNPRQVRLKCIRVFLARSSAACWPRTQPRFVLASRLR